MSYWGHLAREHWQRHLPQRYAALEDPDAFFDALDDEASTYYTAIRDGLLAGLNPNNGTISWAEFLDRVASADQTAHEIVETELVVIPTEDDEDRLLATHGALARRRVPHGPALPTSVPQLDQATPALRPGIANLERASGRLEPTFGARVTTMCDFRPCCPGKC